MAGKNEKVNFLNDIDSMVNNQKEENQMLRRKKVESKYDVPVSEANSGQDVKEQSVTEHLKVGGSRAAKAQMKKVQRSKMMNVPLDPGTHKSLALIKLEHNFEMRDMAYIAIRKFLDEYMEGNELNEKGINYLEKKLKELNG